MVKKYVKCKNCGYLGVVDCIEELGCTGATCICPECDYVISDRKEN